MSSNFKDEVHEALEKIKNSLANDGEITEQHLEVLLLTSLLEEESK